MFCGSGVEVYSRLFHVDPNAKHRHSQRSAFPAYVLFGIKPRSRRIGNLGEVKSIRVIGRKLLIHFPEPFNMLLLFCSQLGKGFLRFLAFRLVAGKGIEIIAFLLIQQGLPNNLQFVDKHFLTSNLYLR